MEHLITVFTPTYNRAGTLRRLFESLTSQTSYQFEWLIVDDGSTDNTEELIIQLQKKCTSFKIRYLKKENGGKHTAINKGIQLAKGFLFFIVDSDDYLTPDAIASIINWEQSIASKDNFAGVSGNRGYSNHQLIGETFDGDYLDATALERNQCNILGDKAEIYYTDVLQRYPFPVFENERFLTESIVWNRMAEDGLKIRWFNKIIYITEYRDDGLTKHYVQLLGKNPQGYALDVKERIRQFNYSKQRVDSEYFNYYITVKKNVSFAAAAKYLNLSKFNLLKAILCYYSRVLIRKVTAK